METNDRRQLEDMLRQLRGFPFIFPEDLPQIDLYMDQVTSLMEEHLAATRRCESDKILTKTMINNYAKNHLLPPPFKKKYGKEHILMLTYIYYFKGILSLQDIQALLEPLWKEFSKDSGSEEIPDIEHIYREECARRDEQLSKTEADILESLESAEKAFKGCPEKERRFLQRFYMVCLLGADIYLRRRVMEQLIDQLQLP